MAGLVETSIAVLSRDAVAAALLSRMRRVLSPKVSEAAGGAIGGTDKVYVSWGRVRAR